MPSTYTPDPTAAQAPAVVPEPEGAPAIQLPADGEPANVASIGQAYKALGDYVAWLFKPRAKVGSYAQPIQRWRNARLQRRFGIDHLGFPAGKLVHLRDSMLTEVADIANGGEVAIPGMPGWKYRILATAGTPQILALAPDTTFPGGRRLALKAGDNNGNYTQIGTPSAALFAANVSAVVEFDLKLSDAVNLAYDVVGGLVSGLSYSLSTLPGGVYFIDGIGPNWGCVVGASTNVFDSGVPLDTDWHRFRVEWIGSGVDDSAASRACFYIDGVLVQNITTGLPAASAYIAPFVSVERIGSGGAQTAYLGAPLTFSANTWQDAF